MRPSVSPEWRSIVTAVVVALVFGPSALAQTDVTTSRISGAVRDVNGLPLPGATVAAQNEETGLVKVSPGASADGPAAG